MAHGTIVTGYVYDPLCPANRMTDQSTGWSYLLTDRAFVLFITRLIRFPFRQNNTQLLRLRFFNRTSDKTPGTETATQLFAQSFSGLSDDFSL